MEENVDANDPVVNNRRKPKMTSDVKKEVITFLMMKMKPNPTQICPNCSVGHSRQGLNILTVPRA